MDKLHIRDCHTQLRSIRRLILQLSDDLGDLTVGRGDDDLRAELGEMQDAITEAEHKMHGFQARLEKLSRGGV